MNYNNGRVTFPKNDTIPFALYDKIPVNQCTTYQEPLLGIWDDSTLSKVYFSQENVQIIQNGIRAGVYQQSNNQYIIGNQNCDTLKIIMRSVYLQHSINNKQHIKKQIENLNKIVLDYCVTNILGEAQGYLTYIKDVSTLATPMDRPVMTSTNDKQLLLKEWF